MEYPILGKKFLDSSIMDGIYKVIVASVRNSTKYRMTQNQITYFLKWFLNKFWHLLECFIIVAFFTLWLGILVGLIAGIIAGVAKESWDKWRGGVFDHWDLCSDVLGTVLGVWIITKFG